MTGATPGGSPGRDFAAVGFGLGVFGLGAAIARAGRVGEGERRLFRKLNGLPDALFYPAWVVMQAGSLAAVWVATAMAAKAGCSRRAISLGLSGVGVWAGCKAVKPLIGRGRPAVLLSDVRVRGRPQAGLGYPSGHAAVAANLAVVLASGSTRFTRRGLVAVAGTVAFGRIYTGAHLPVDALGGLAIGVVTGAAARLALGLSSRGRRVG